MKTKNKLMLILFLIAALVVSALVAEITKSLDFMKWLTWGESIGFNVTDFDLAIINLSFSFYLQVNLLQIILLIAAGLLHKKLFG